MMHSSAPFCSTYCTYVCMYVFMYVGIYCCRIAWLVFDLCLVRPVDSERSTLNAEGNQSKTGSKMAMATTTQMATVKLIDNLWRERDLPMATVIVSNSAPAPLPLYLHSTTTSLSFHHPSHYLYQNIWRVKFAIWEFVFNEFNEQLFVCMRA